MAKKVILTPARTYATEANADKAVSTALGDSTAPDGRELRYFIQRTQEGRYYPVFLGERALHAGVHHRFNVVM
jgi:hypothetical protein